MQGSLAGDVGDDDNSLGAELQAEGLQLLDKTIQTFWPDEDMWWSAVVVGYDADSETHW